MRITTRNLTKQGTYKRSLRMDFKRNRDVLITLDQQVITDLCLAQIREQARDDIVVIDLK